ncbi:MAG TPA: type II secretion system protein [Pyrinomonadaceae bacterium]|nr:type II secretion system protein [Pyrinomonadaceae bacterium]
MHCRKLANSDLFQPRASLRRDEQGYTLIALLAVMSIMALLLVAAAPSIQQQTQRTLEEEAIWRGEQVAEAIRLYVRLNPRHQLPTSMDDLLEGAPTNGPKKIQVLRPVAARDPLSSTGEWRLIKKTDAAFIDFTRAVIAYAGRPVNTTDTVFTSPSAAGPPPQLTNVLDLGTTEESSGGEDTSTNSPGQFIGVASRSRRNSIITYYGIERHDKWIFTPYFR